MIWPWIAALGGLVIWSSLRASDSGSSGAMVWPVKPYRGILNPFGAPREDGARIHAGVDVGAYPGDPIVAVTDGVVVRHVTGYGIGAGLDAIAITHPEFDLLYGEIDVTVKPGDHVTAGDVIGRARKNKDGNTMLHIEAWERGMSPAQFTRWMRGNPPPKGLLNVQKILDDIDHGAPVA